ncbi:MAG: hypothetical protein DWQ09_08435 [Proteobacteria bacterium]|nr:MAG: hypothetical protein DWQ09_08435 [Pseudomonadota bacterium]QKK10807.1 MAG: hypothetical protein HND59_03565 [Pseudomonadota bacterium]
MHSAIKTLLHGMAFAVIAGCTSSVVYQGESGVERLEYHATSLNTHCRDPQLAKRLRAMGPLYAIGASVSHGLFSTSFPSLIRDQMCLADAQYDSDFYFLFVIKLNSSILDSLQELRPNLIVAMDFPYHYVKMQYAEKAKPDLKKYILMLLMDCASELIDCSEGGEFEFQRTARHRPTVLTGSIYFDCRSDDWAEDWEKAFPDYEVCREENRKLNVYLRELEREYPKLHVLPAYEMFSALHDTPEGVFHYDVNGVKVDFRKSDLFFDGFHAWTNPGAYVLANLVIDHFNRIGREVSGDQFTAVPYIPLELDR